MCYGLIYLYNICSFLLKDIVKGEVVASRKANSCRVTAANLNRMILASERHISQLFTIDCHFNHFFSLSQRHIGWRHAVDVAAGAAQAHECDFMLKPSGAKQRPRVLVVL